MLVTSERSKMSDYPDQLNRLLAPPREGRPLVLDLFAGAGGLALGFEACGFSTEGFESDPDCATTYSRNLAGSCTVVTLTPETTLPPAPVIIGGPPCQPFSVGGKQAGPSDRRDGMPAFVSAIQRLRPEIWLLENVRGMLYRNRPYFEEIVQKLRALDYIVEVKLLNAVHYGVPQNRERVFVVGHRGRLIPS